MMGTGNDNKTEPPKTLTRQLTTADFPEYAWHGCQLAPPTGELQIYTPSDRHADRNTTYSPGGKVIMKNGMAYKDITYHDQPVLLQFLPADLVIYLSTASSSLVLLIHDPVMASQTSTLPGSLSIPPSVCVTDDNRHDYRQDDVVYFPDPDDAPSTK